MEKMALLRFGSSPIKSSKGRALDPGALNLRTRARGRGEGGQMGTPQFFVNNSLKRPRIATKLPKT